ncbi:MAG: hypothetical protein ACRYGR_01710 [Janthinobacterium lividum]
MTKFLFTDKCQIEILSKEKLIIFDQQEVLKFNTEDTAVFHHGTGEKVTEYSGLATDKNEERSWAKADFEVGGFSPQHYHLLRTKDYYIVSMQAKVSIIVEGKDHLLTTGDHLRVLPNQRQQIINRSENNKCSLIVKCTPSWILSDFICLK